MEHKETFRKSVAWTILLSMLNPAAMVPAVHARDTDIYTSVQTSSQTAEPNILIILDTSDSMNLPEAWREYPGAYDSHTEYLWNDTTYFAGIVLPSALPNPPAWPTTDYGTWGGAGVPPGGTTVERTQLRTNAIAWRDATQAGDPGPRNIYRNYGGGRGSTYSSANWVFWLPAGTATTDLRLMAPSFNKAAIGAANLTGTRGGITFPATSSYLAFNKCTDSLTSATMDPLDTTLPMGLLPSTVYYPTTYASNSGKYLNQQWQRWEKWLRLSAQGFNNGYGVAASDFTASAFAGGATYAGGYIAVASTTTAKQDNAPPSTILGGNQQPIRQRVTAGSTSTQQSYAGWTNLKADLGGYNYQGVVQGYATAVLGNVILQYAPTSTATLDNFKKAYLGNRDRTGPAPTYDNTFGTPSYYDNLPGTCVAATGGPGVTTTCVKLSTGSVAGTPYTQTTTRYCVKSPTNSSGVNSANATFYYGGSCVMDTGTYPALTEPPAAYATVAGYRCTGNAPSAAVPSTVTGVPPYYYPCPAPATGPTPAGSSGGGGPPAACVMGGGTATYASTTYSSCNWKGRASVYVEGPGDFWVNGSCTGDKYTSTGGASRTLVTTNDPANCTVTVGALPNGAVASQTLNGIAYTNVMNKINAGPNGGGNGSTYQCANKATVNTNCNTLPGAPATCNNNTCSNQTASNTNTVGTVLATDTYYTVLPQLANDTYLNHDCRADDPDNRNFNSPAGYMTNQTDSATWNLAWSTAVAVSNTPYTSDNTKKVTTAPNIDMYSVNYLNWKWGPHSNGNPIGRKTRLQIAKDALSTLVDTTNGVRFGLEVFNRTKTDFTDTGGNIAFKIKRTGTTDATDPAFGTAPNTAALANRAPIKAAIGGLVGAARTPLTEALYEAYVYFRGDLPWSGLRAGAAVVGGVENTGYDTTAICAAAGVAAGVCTAIGKYESPMMSNPNPPGVGSPIQGPAACQKNFVLLITDGGPEDDGSANTIIKALTYTSASGTTYSPDTTLDAYQPDTGTKQLETAPAAPYGPTDLAGTAEDPPSNGYVWLDELAWYMSRADMNVTLTGAQPVITYTIGFAGANSPVLQNAAAVAGGNYYIADDSAGLATALASAIAAIRQWNPSASAPTVPISALNRTENSSDVFLAFFGPSGLTNWDGTVKKFHLGPAPAGSPPVRPPAPNECLNDLGVNPAVCLTGQTTLLPAGTANIEQTIIDVATGAQSIIVNDAAVSYWTPLSGVIPAPVGGNYPLLDGGKPGIGGTGHQLVITGTPAARNMYTHLSTSGSASLTAAVNAMKDTNAAITPTVLGNAGLTAPQRNTLINWARGGNTAGDATCNDAGDDGSTACASFRSWAHSAVLHSKPAVVNYGANNQTLFYISTDGVLHAVDPIDTAGTGGKERWSFMIEEALPQLATLMANLPGTDNQLSVADGTPVLYIDDANKDGYVNGGDKAWLYFGLRRGGRAYYALDVTSRDAPVMMWKITPTQICTGTSCGASASYAEMGDTWSTPAVAKLRAMPAGIPAVIFGGGYDTNQDNQPVVAADTRGRALFIARGDNGGLLKAFTSPMAYSVPSDPAALDMDSDAQHFVDRVYIGDMGGGVWRFDVNNASVAVWAGRKIAQLTTGTGKIFYPPVVVRQFFDGERFDAVYAGTGDKEHPLLLGTTDKMFMIKDLYTGFASAQASAYAYPTDFVDASQGSAFDTVTLAPAQLATFHASHGWYYSLQTSEKVSSSAEVFYNVLNFGTYTPVQSLNACLPPGLGQLYGLNAIFAGKADTDFVGGVTAADPPTYGSVGIKGRGFVSPGGVIVVAGKVYRITVVDGALKTIEGNPQLRQRAYWQLEPEL